jgi:hypothetical protein
MEQSSILQDLHITIGSSPNPLPTANRGVDLTNDIEMVKAAVLYADRATLCSPAYSALLDGTNLVELKTSERIKFIETIPLWYPNQTHLMSQAEEFLSRYKAAWNQRTTPSGYLFLKRFERELDKVWSQMVDPFRELLSESGGSEIKLASESGLLEMHRFDSPLNRIMIDAERDGFLQEYVSAMGSTISNHATYPLFDNSTGKVISAGIAARVIPVSESSVTHGKEVSLAADLFARLPTFAAATMAEILDIRGELDSSLCRFRRATITFSEAIKNASWDKEFAADAETVFRRDVAPAILELEEQVTSNTLVSKFMRELSTRSFQVGTAITGSATASALIAHMSNLPLTEIAALAIPVITIAGVAYKAYDDWRSEKRSIEQNNLFFYYRAGRLLQEGTYEYFKQST